jgi:TonB-dependent starch-binding outer membrane protein SusC
MNHFFTFMGTQKLSIKRFFFLNGLVLMFTLFAYEPSFAVGKVVFKPVKGKVLDEDGNGLPGASILIKKTTKGTMSNQNGEFEIDVKKGDVLTFTLVGYKASEITYNDQALITVSMVTDDKTLDEVVVTGYGVQRKSDLMGSVSSLKSEAIKDLPVTSVEQALQGRMTGVQVQQSSGQPGAGISIRVRGVTSIAGGNEPLFVIDGIPQFNNDNRSLNGLSLFNSNDIESIEVLKDAASTAIYGSRGANGVVMITTKSGKPGKQAITYETTFSQQEVRKTLKVMTGDEWLGYVKEWFANSNRALTPEVLNATNANTDWQKEIFRKALQQTHNLSFSGGTEKTQYFVSANYTKQDGIIKGSDFSRGSFRFNLNTKLSEKAGLRTYITASQAVQNGFSPANGTNTRNFGKSGIGSVLLATPTVPTTNPDGSWGNARPFSFNGLDVENPLAFATDALDRNKVTRFQGGMDFNVKILPNLTNTVRFGTDYITSRADLYLPRTLLQVTSGVGLGQLGLNSQLSLLVEDYLEYKKKITSKLEFEGIVGLSYQNVGGESTRLSGSGYLSDDIKNYNFSAASTVAKPVTDLTQNIISSSFGRVRFNYDDKYLLSASLRRDGASVFSKNKKYATFPSVGFAWRISQEEFLKNSKVISNLKLRSSWGESGNQAIQPYQSLSLGNVVNTAQGAGSGLAVGLAPTLPNDNLTWETTAQTNFGLDLGFLNERFRVSFDYYNKNTSSLLATVQLPPSAGYSTIIDNVGEVENKGFEIELGGDIVNTSKFRWTLEANFSRNLNTVLKTKDNRDLFSGGANDASQNTSVIRVGQPLSAFWGPKFNGFDDKGNQTFVDQNANGIIDATDFVPLGSPYPDLIYGFTSTLKYKNLSFMMTWQGLSGNRINNVNLYSLTTPTIEYNRLANIREFYPKPANGLVLYRSDLYIEDGSYLRLRNIRVDYKLPISSNKFVKMANVYVSGQNLVTQTKYSGFDPEVNFFSGNDLRQGVDLGAYPVAMILTLGASITF